MPDEDNVQLQLHLAPKEAVEISELTAALTSLSRQYQIYVDRNFKLAKGTTAKLLVSSVAPGSIDIGLLPQIKDAAMDAAALAVPYVGHVGLVADFAKHVKSLIETFSGKNEKVDKDEQADISVRDCDDAINIVKPIAEHGGSQTFNVYHGPVVQQVFKVDAASARDVIQEASRVKAALQFPEAERHQRVPLVWTRLDRNAAKKEGSSPDKGTIEDIDRKPHPVLFADEFTYLKKEMVGGEGQPFQTVYFVDVEVSRVGGKAVSYRVVGYHGSEDLEGDEIEPGAPEA